MFKSTALFAVLLIALLLLTSAAITTAQTDDEPACDPAELAAAYTEQLAEVESLDDLTAIQYQIGSDIANCSGLVIEGDADELKIIGPIDIPEGLYRVVTTTSGGIIVRALLLDGECEPATGYGFSEGFAAHTSDQASDGAEQLYESSGCSLLFEVQLASEPYRIEFQKLR